MKAGRIPSRKTKGQVSVLERLAFLNRHERHAVLATEALGQPYTSLIAFALTPDMGGLVFGTPRDTAKYRNMVRNRRVAVLIDTRSNDPRGYMEAEALTILGSAKTVRRGKAREELARVFGAKHPALEGFIQAQSTALVLVQIERCYHVSAFQSVTEWRPAAVGAVQASRQR